MSRQKRYEGTVEMSCIAKTNQAPRTSENTHTKGGGRGERRERETNTKDSVDKAEDKNEDSRDELRRRAVVARVPARGHTVLARRVPVPTALHVEAQQQHRRRDDRDADHDRKVRKERRDAHRRHAHQRRAHRQCRHNGERGRRSSRVHAKDGAQRGPERARHGRRERHDRRHRRQHRHEDAPLPRLVRVHPHMRAVPRLCPRLWQ